MLTSMREFFKGKGQGIVEYALLLAFVVAIAIFALRDGSLGKALSDNFSKTAGEVTTFSVSTGSSSSGT